MQYFVCISHRICRDHNCRDNCFQLQGHVLVLKVMSLVSQDSCNSGHPNSALVHLTVNAQSHRRAMWRWVGFLLQTNPCSALGGHTGHSPAGICAQPLWHQENLLRLPKGRMELQILPGLVWKAGVL